MIGEKVFAPMLSSRETIMHAWQIAPVYVFFFIDMKCISFYIYFSIRYVTVSI